MKKGPLSVASFLLMILILGGCCHPPVREISMVQSHLEQAQKAGIPTYAPEKYKEARDLLEKARATRECGEAWKALQLAQMKMKEAREEALKARLQARKKAQEALKKARQALEEAKKAQAPRYAPDLFLVGEELLKKAREDFTKGKFLLGKKEADKAALLATKAKTAAIKVKKELGED